jgi:hypothetical protein
MATSIVTTNLKYRIIKSLQEKFSDLNESVYFFYGRPLKWDNEESPDFLVSSVKDENRVKSNIMALKKISSRDIILGAKKYKWTHGEVYDVYTDQEDIADKKYYVITSTNKVYKCLDNNTQYVNSTIVRTPSIDEPDGDGPLFVGSNDRYIWKYMFTVSNPILRKFNIPDYIPINSTLSTTEIPGTIDYIKLESNGINYTLEYIDDNGAVAKFDKLPLFIFGNGDEVTTAKIRINSITSGDRSINIQNTEPLRGLPGGGYTLTSNRGSGYRITEDEWTPVQIRQISSSIERIELFEYAYGIAKISLNDGSIETLRIINPGKGYSLGDAEIVQSSAIAYANLDPQNGYITSTKVEFPGRGFTTAEVIIISDKPDNPNTNAILTPIISPPFGHNSNPEAELNATNMLFNIRIAYEELGGDFSVSNDFRSIGLIENIKQQNADGSNVRLSLDNTVSAKTNLICNSNVDVNAFSGDSTIIGSVSGAKATIVDVVNDNTIRIIRNQESSNYVQFLVGETVISGGKTAIISQIDESEYVPFSGDILFINNKQKIDRSSDQIETINFILTV